MQVFGGHTQLFAKLGGCMKAAQRKKREAVRGQLTGQKCTPQETQNKVNKRAERQRN